MKTLKHTIEAHAIDEIEYVDGHRHAEPGWFIFLKDGCSFDPMDVNDNCRFVPASNPDEAMNLLVVEHPGYTPDLS
jgi:hypothetical protein